jgi:hypothetical protein
VPLCTRSDLPIPLHTKEGNGLFPWCSQEGKVALPQPGSRRRGIFNRVTPI